MEKIMIKVKASTLMSLIEEQTGINEQTWKKFHPVCLFTK